MPNDRGTELVKQWVKAIFAILLGIAFIMVFDSVFLAIMAWTFLFFIPSANREVENSFSAAFFNLGMAVLLFLAFFQSELLGLGLETPPGIDLEGAATTGQTFDVLISESPFSTILIGLLFLTLVVKGVMSFAPTRGAEEPSTLMWISSVGVYVLMIALVIILQVWTWSTASIIFIAVWFMAYISGSSGDQDSRQVVGVIMIVVAFVIFSMGVGSSAVGEAFFGQWYPIFYQSISGVMEPLSEAFQSLGETFQNSIFLISNPTGYAQSIVNGSYERDPETGIAGAYGVEVDDARNTPIYSNQSYTLLVKVKNRGAFEATGIRVGVEFAENKPGKKSSWEGKEMDMHDLGFREVVDNVYCTGEACWQWMDSEVENEFVKQDLRQLFFPSSGIGCPAINEYGLKTRPIPLKATVQYGYTIDSTMEVGFISSSEWDRLVLEGGMITQQKKVASFTNAPVRLNLDTLEQPIREGTPYFIGLNLVSAKKGGMVESIGTPILESKVDISCATMEDCVQYCSGKAGPGERARIETCSHDFKIKCTCAVQDLVGGIELSVPAELGELRCTPAPAKITEVEDSRGKLESRSYLWTEEVMKGNYLAYCSIDAADFSKFEGSPPEKTFILRASANYTFGQEEDFLPARLEFGGTVCCTENEECPGGMVCDANEETCKVVDEEYLLNEAEKFLDNSNSKQSSLMVDIKRIINGGKKEGIGQLINALREQKMEVDSAINKYSEYSFSVKENEKKLKEVLYKLSINSINLEILIGTMELWELYYNPKDDLSYKTELESKIKEETEKLLIYSSWEDIKEVKENIKILKDSIEHINNSLSLIYKKHR